MTKSSLPYAVEIYYDNSTRAQLSPFESPKRPTHAADAKIRWIKSLSVRLVDMLACSTSAMSAAMHRTITFRRHHREHTSYLGLHLQQQPRCSRGARNFRDFRSFIPFVTATARDRARWDGELSASAATSTFSWCLAIVVSTISGLYCRLPNARMLSTDGRVVWFIVQSVNQKPPRQRLTFCANTCFHLRWNCAAHVGSFWLLTTMRRRLFTPPPPSWAAGSASSSPSSLATAGSRPIGSGRWCYRKDDFGWIQFAVGRSPIVRPFRMLRQRGKRGTAECKARTLAPAGVHGTTMPEATATGRREIIAANDALIGSRLCQKRRKLFPRVVARRPPPTQFASNARRPATPHDRV